MARGLERPPLWAVIVMVLGAAWLVGGMVYSGTRSATDPVSSAEAARMAAAASKADASEAAAAPKSVAFLGDSYAAGVGASNPSSRFSTLLSRRENWVEINVACGGSGYLNPGPDCKGPFPTQVDAAVQAQPQIALVFGGRNDLQAGTATEVQTSAEATFSALRRRLPHVRVVVVSPVWDDNPEPPGFAELRQSVQTAARAAGVQYVDIGEPLRGHRDWLISDDVHPNDQGHKAIADAVAAALTRL